MRYILAFALIALASCATTLDTIEKIRRLYNEQDKNGRTPVHRVVMENNVQRLQVMLDEGAEVNIQDDDGKLPLHIAAANNNAQATRLLIASGSQTDTQDKAGNTPIHSAALQDAAEAITVLLVNGVDPEISNAAGQTPAVQLIQAGKSISLAAMEQNGADMLYIDPSGDSLLHIAVDVRNEGAVKSLLELGADYTIFDNDGYTPVHSSASQNGQDESLAHFFNKGADVNMLDRSGDTLLHVSITNGASQSLEYLINKGADYNTPNHRNIIPVFMAVLGNNNKALAVLEKYGADLQPYNEQGFAPIHVAVTQRRKKALSELITLGVDVDFPVKDKGTTAMQLSARLGLSELQRVLFQAGASVVVGDIAGNTVLHYASAFDKPSSVKQAVRHGANINALNARLETPTHVAIRSKSLGALRELVRENPDLTIRDYSGNQPLHVALDLDLTNDVRLLLKNEANPNVLSGNNISPIVQTLSVDGLLNLKQLLENGANVNAVDAEGKYPLHRAAELNKPKAILVMAQASPLLDVLSKQGNNGETAIHTASAMNHVLSIRALAKVGAKTDILNARGDTPLHSAVITNSIQSIEELLALGASPLIRDAKRRTSLFRAIAENKPQAVEILMEYGPQDQHDSQGNTPVLNAIQLENADMIRLILRLGGSASAANFAGDKPLSTVLNKREYDLAYDLVTHGADITEPLDVQGNTACDLTADASWQQSCLRFFRDETYLAKRERWLNLGKPRQYLYSIWKRRIPHQHIHNADPIASIREESDRNMRFYLAFSLPETYLTDLEPPEPPVYELEQLPNESNAAFSQRLEYIQQNYQQPYQRALEKYERVRKQRLQTIDSFRTYNMNEDPSKQRVALDFNADAILTYLRSPLITQAVDYDRYEGILRARLVSKEGLAVSVELLDSDYAEYNSYIDDYGRGLPWYPGVLVNSESFVMTHLITPTPYGMLYLAMNQDEHKYLIQRFLTLRGEKTFTQ